MTRLALLRSALLTWPTARLWLRTLAELVWLAPALAFLAWAGGLTNPSDSPDAPSLAKLAAIALIAPAFLEEIVFRVLLLPVVTVRAPFWPYAISIGLFVLWHPLQILIFGPSWAQTVLNPAFLIAVAALGLALTRIYLATQSVWPSTIVHWLVVIIWKVMGGASPWG